MAGTDSTFASAGMEMNVPHKTRDTEMGNPNGDVVDKTEGNNPINGSSGETAVEPMDASTGTINTRPQWDTSQDPIWPNS